MRYLPKSAKASIDTKWHQSPEILEIQNTGKLHVRCLFTALLTFPIFRKSGKSGYLKNRLLGVSGIRKSDFLKSRFPKIRKSELSDFRTSESTDIWISGNLKTLIFGFPVHRMQIPRHPMPGIRGVRTHQRNMVNQDLGDLGRILVAMSCFARPMHLFSQHGDIRIFTGPKMVTFDIQKSNKSPKS